uniref:Uncharacterized protein n=1 Tax=Oryza glumipatula TaxID=40148 RepID=A0A0D9ZY42_9ORYZ
MALQVRRTGGDGGKKAVLRRGGGVAVAERKRRYGQGPQGGGMAARRGGDKVGSKREDKTGPGASFKRSNICEDVTDVVFCASEGVRS